MSNKRVSLAERNENQVSRTVGAFISNQEDTVNAIENKVITKLIPEPINKDESLSSTEDMNITNSKPLIKTKVKPLIKTLCEDKGDDINRIISEMVSEVERIIDLEKNKSGFMSNRPVEKFDMRNPAMAIPSKPEIHDIMEYLAKRFKKYGMPKYLIFEKIFINGLKNTNFEE